jgi:hypothetical protein
MPARDKAFNFKLSPDDRSKIEAAAAVAGQTLSAFVRHAVLTAAAEITGGQPEPGQYAHGGDRRSVHARAALRKAS